MAKKLMINCGNCDARFVREETLAAYESTVINCGAVWVTQETKDLLNRYNVTMNCGNVMQIPQDVKIKTINGRAVIKSGDILGEPVYLMVNGTLEIGPGTEKILGSYVGIYVNGNVTYPDSLSSVLGMLAVNGVTNCYPDGAIVLKNNTTIDYLFALRAKNALYWSPRRLVMVDPRLNGETLAAKGASFQAKEVILAEGKVEELVPLIDEQAQIVIVPDSTAVIADDVELDEMTVKKYGTRLYILGDVKLSGDCAAALKGLSYLNVQGNISVAEENRPALLEILTECSGEIKVEKYTNRRVIEDKMTLRISRWLLEQEPEGIHVRDCMKLILDTDISGELILDKLSVSDCMKIQCTPEQEPALGMVCEDVFSIGENDDDKMGIGGMLKTALAGAGEVLNTKVINAGDYVL